jgi:hypothetical protein
MLNAHAPAATTAAAAAVKNTAANTSSSSSGCLNVTAKPLHKGGHVKLVTHHNDIPTTLDYLAKLNTTMDFSSAKDSSPTNSTAIANGSANASANISNTTPSPTSIRGRCIPQNSISSTADSVTPPKPNSRITSPGL